MRASRWITALFLATLVRATTAFADGDKLNQAIRLFEALELEQALQALDAAAQVPGNDRAALLTIYELQGIAHAALGHPEKARDAFRALCLLDPEHKLGKQPPRVRTQFYEAKAWSSSHGPLVIEAEPVREGDLVDSLHLSVKGDPLNLVRSVAVTIEQQGAPPRRELVKLDKRGQGSLKVGAVKFRYTVAALGDRDATLMALAPREELPQKKERATTSLPLSPPPPPAQGDLKGSPTPPGWMRPTSYALVGGGALAAGIGVYFELRAQNARHTLDSATRDPDTGVITGVTQKQAAALDQQARSGALTANVLFGVGGGLAATGALLFFLGTPSAQQVTVAPAPNGIIVVGSF